MGKSCYIRLTPESKKQYITLHELSELLHNYSSMLKDTGKQLNWDYAAVSFPYEIKEQTKNGTTYLLLEGHPPEKYHSLLLGIRGNDNNEIQLTLTPQSTFGDKSKANEFAKFLAKQLKGELHLFNERIIYYTKMKV